MARFALTSAFAIMIELSCDESSPPQDAAATCAELEQACDSPSACCDAPEVKCFASRCKMCLVQGQVCGADNGALCCNGCDFSVMKCK